MLYRERATAKLLVSYRGEERTFWFDRGQILSASSNREAQLVGDLLRTFGLADESLLMSAFEKALAEPGRGLARALTESGAVADYVADAAVAPFPSACSSRRSAGRAASSRCPRSRARPSCRSVPTGPPEACSSRLFAGFRLRPPSSTPRFRPRRGRFAPDLLLRYQAFTVSAVEAEVLGASTAP